MPQNTAQQARPEPLTAGECFILDWQYRHAVGSFRKALTDAIINADENNLRRMARAFPEECEAIQRFRNQPGYLEQTRAKAAALGLRYGNL